LKKTNNPIISSVASPKERNTSRLSQGPRGGRKKKGPPSQSFGRERK